MAVNAFENFTSAQIAAVRDGTLIAGIADAINETLTYLGSKGGTLFLPYGLYDLRAALVVPSEVYLKGEGPSFPANIPFNQGFTRTNGTVLAKNHAGNAITVTGAGAYTACGGIENIAISSDKAVYAGGHGLVVDKVGSYRIKELRVFSVGGDGIVLGTTAGDVTGQIHMEGVYVNSVGGASIRNRSRWLKAIQVETDGGTHGLICTDTTNVDFTQFHFEGATSKGIEMAGANKFSRFAGGFVAMTSSLATKAIDVLSVAGNTDILFDHVQVVGGATLTVGIDIGASAWQTTIRDCNIGGGIPIGVRDDARYTTIENTTFDTCAKGLQSNTNANDSTYRDNKFLGTSGASDIEHVAGTRGLWTGNIIGKTITATASGIPGNFNGIRVKDNPGYVTRNSGTTGNIATGTAVSHGLAGVPKNIITHDFFTSGVTGPYQSVAATSTQFTKAWGGTTPAQYAWEAACPCDY